MNRFTPPGFFAIELLMRTVAGGRRFFWGKDPGSLGHG